MAEASLCPDPGRDLGRLAAHIDHHHPPGLHLNSQIAKIGFFTTDELNRASGRPVGLQQSGAAVADGALANRQFRIIRPDGTMRWVRSCGKLMHGPDGRPSHMVGVTFDVTDLRNANAAYQQQDGLLEALKTLFEVVIWRTEPDGSVADAFEWWRSTGQDAGRASGWGRLHDVHPEDRQKVWDAWAAALNDRRRYAAEFRVRDADGNYVPSVSRGISILDAAGRIQGWVGFSTKQRADAASALPGASRRDDGAVLTPAEIRAARGFLGWTANALPARSGVSFSTIRRMETPGEGNLRTRSHSAVREAFEKAGIQFVTGRDGSMGIFVK